MPSQAPNPSISPNSNKHFPLPQHISFHPSCARESSQFLMLNDIVWYCFGSEHHGHWLLPAVNSGEKLGALLTAKPFSHSRYWETVEWMVWKANQLFINQSDLELQVHVEEKNSIWWILFYFFILWVLLGIEQLAFTPLTPLVRLQDMRASTAILPSSFLLFTLYIFPPFLMLPILITHPSSLE